MAIENRTSRRTYELEKCFLEKYFLSELRIFWSSLFQSIATEGKGEFWKKLSFTLNRGILLVFFVFYVITEVILILNKYFRHWYLKTLKMHNSFLYHLFFSRVSKPSSLYSFSLNVHPIALVAGQQWPLLCCTELTFIFEWDVALYVWSYMAPSQLRWGLIKEIQIVSKSGFGNTQ